VARVTQDARLRPGGWLAAALLAVLAAPQAPAYAAYPERPIRLILPFPAGSGPTDVVSRLFGQKLGEVLGQQVVADNRGGASGIIACEITSRAVPDGYTLLLGTVGTLTINPSIYRKLPYAPARDFRPVSLLSASPYVLVVNAAVPARSVRDLVALARARPGQLNFASGGVGTGNHLSGELFKLAAGVDITHVPYKGASLAIGDVVAGQVQTLFVNVVAALPHVKTGRVRALAVSSPRRAAVAPDIPTFAESGYPVIETASWHGVVAPVRVPNAVVARLNEALVLVARQPEVRERLEAQGAEVFGTTPEQYAAHIRSETEKWAKGIAAAGIRPE